MQHLKSKLVRILFILSFLIPLSYYVCSDICRICSILIIAGGDNLRTTLLVDGQLKDVPDYAKVQGILIGCVAAFVVAITIVGPEHHGAHFEKGKAAFEEGAGAEDAEDYDAERERVRARLAEKEASPRESIREEAEKGSIV